MSAEENKERVRRFMEEAFSQGKVEVVDEVLDPDFVCHDPNSETGVIRGAETLKGEIGQLWESWLGVMPLFMDHHKGVEGLTAEAVAEAHRKDMEIQEDYGVSYHRYWFNEESGEVFCLAEAPNKEAAEAVHREAHGLVADEIVEVKEGS